jgi:hypothetical protein
MVKVRVPGNARLARKHFSPVRPKFGGERMDYAIPRRSLNGLIIAGTLRIGRLSCDESRATFAFTADQSEWFEFLTIQELTILVASDKKTATARGATDDECSDEIWPIFMWIV